MPLSSPTQQRAQRLLRTLKNPFVVFVLCLVFCTGLRGLYWALNSPASPWAFFDSTRVVLVKLLMILFTPSMLLSGYLAAIPSLHLKGYRVILECLLTSTTVYVILQSLLLWPNVARRAQSAIDAPTSPATLEETQEAKAELPKPQLWSVNRRQFLRASVAVATIPPVGSLAYGSFLEPNRLAVRRYALAIKNLPPEFAGLRIVHLSDTHYGPYVTLGQIQAAIDQANALKPDLVFLTGDYVLDSPRFIEEGIAIFGGLKPRHGMLAVLGNHDHWEGAEPVRDGLRKLGAHLLDNQRLFLTPSGKFTDKEPTEPSLALCGVGDYWEDTMDFEAVLSNFSPNTPRLVLSHNPDSADLIPKELRCDALFCGHTHGGQINLPGFPNMSPVKNKLYTGGKCDGPTCPVYVSRGVGMSVLPYRLNVPPEISLFTLEVG